MLANTSRHLFVPVFTACVALTGCMSTETDESNPSLGETSAGLESKWISCGQALPFQTWSGWGYTTVEAVNHNPEKGVVRLAYQAGAGSTVYRNVYEFEQWGARWGGFALWITYLGYYDSSGQYRNCDQNGQPGGWPDLLVQTY